MATDRLAWLYTQDYSHTHQQSILLTADAAIRDGHGEHRTRHDYDSLAIYGPLTRA
jgi:hypothetical protein